MLDHAYSIIIDHVVRSLVHGKYFVYGLNTTNKNYISTLKAQSAIPRIKGLQKPYRSSHLNPYIRC